MLHHVLLVKLKQDLPPSAVENLMVETRIRLLKIPEVRNLQCGKKIDTKNNPYDFFLAMDLESQAKLRVVQESAIYHQFQQQILFPSALETLAYNYEMDPGKDIKFS